MLDNKDYCDYETCVALKELGYKGISRFFYATKESPLRRYSYDQILTTRIADAVGHTLAISLYSAQKWLREEKKIEVNATYDNIVELHWHWYMKSLTNRNQIISNTNHDSYEQALLAGIKEAVKILKDGNNN